MQKKVVEVNTHEIETPYSFLFVFQYIGILFFISLFIYLLYHYYHTKEIFLLSEFINRFSNSSSELTNQDKSIKENPEKSIKENQDKSIKENPEKSIEKDSIIVEKNMMNRILHKMVSKKNKDIKPQYCFVGDYNGKRSCVEIHNESCLSGDIFPSEEKCINPNLCYD